MKWKKPQEWKSGAAIIIVSRLRNGILSISAAIASSPSGLERCAPFGVPVVPEVRITKRGLSGGGFRSDSSPPAISCSSVGSAGLLALVDPADDAGDGVLHALQQAGELGVVDQRLRRLAARHLDQLRPGEHRVQVEGAGAELGGGESRLDEAAVVAAHDPDPVAVADAHRGEGVGERVGAAVQTLEAERAALVDDRDLVRVVDRGGGDPGRRRGAPARKVAPIFAAPCRAASARRSRPRAGPSARRPSRRPMPAACAALVAENPPSGAKTIRSAPRPRRCRRFPRRGRSSPCPRCSSP